MGEIYLDGFEIGAGLGAGDGLVMSLSDVCLCVGDRVRAVDFTAVSVHYLNPAAIIGIRAGAGFRNHFAARGEGFRAAVLDSRSVDLP